ncbi:MAG: alpha-amylase [Dehalococcoidia bacterium]|nr:alpha-amylase [Dehalococcoidia bacterium]
MEFHISRRARDRYQFDEVMFSLNENVSFANFRSVREFAQRMNEKRDLVDFPELAVKAGQLNAMGAIDEILRYVAALYREDFDHTLIGEALDWLTESLGRENIDRTLLQFAREFPSSNAYRNHLDPEAYLKGETAGVPNRQIVVEEMLMLWLANTNPAFWPYKELFDDAELEQETSYLQVISSLQGFFRNKPSFGPDSQNLIDVLRGPAEAMPYSLAGQLQYIWERWGALLGKHLYRLLGALDSLKEEERIRLMAGPGPARVYDFSKLEIGSENFSPDREWMPRVVLMAKSSYVWLDQLSKKYERQITRLDQVPDEELDILSRWGLSGLWLIGVWERSQASQRIKQLTGNPEAAASAYSLFDYEIAADLGGDVAYADLKRRASDRGIRLASDMVPNHMGIESRWVIEHPDWFVSEDYSPFPSYSFDGPELSRDERVSLKIEDHYYSRTDAAVVFKRADRWTGSEKYIYHGNDGTGMPWNDTAQLNYLLPEVREAVIQTILEVARRFSIIRFDAAMTLTKEHYHRLWFPEPGTGGDIPSRAEHGIARPALDSMMPQEFWREVVDRVAEEVPDTLLLAEAFWLMEGYFVRTLGMHRVYNSAFMNMLKNEENAKYRTSIKNVLEFNPEILKRFVNFMNNPDEETAIAQFGKEDKYFGVCLMMVTMPGLPMFGHGQIEGLTERYGMEYRRAYRDEYPDQYLVQRHEREIFPLLHRRHLFAEVRNFLLYDLFTTEGSVNENVFAYSNRDGNERALVAYNNKFEGARGWIRVSAAFIRTEGGDGGMLTQSTLGEGLDLHDDENYFCIFRDHVSNLQYVRSNREMLEKGLYLELGPYKYKVFLDFYEVQDNEQRHYANLAAYLNGGGVPSIEEALQETFSQPVHQPFKELVNPGMFRWLMDNVVADPATQPNPLALDEVEAKMAHLLREIKGLVGVGGDEQSFAREVRDDLEAMLLLPVLADRLWSNGIPIDPGVKKYSAIGLSSTTFMYGCLLGWLFVHSLGKIVNQDDFQQQSRSWIDEWLFRKVIEDALRGLGLNEEESSKAIALIKLLTAHQDWTGYLATDAMPAYTVVDSLLKDDEVQEFLQVNRYQDVLWYGKESFEQLIWWLFTIDIVKASSEKTRPQNDTRQHITESYRLVQKLHSASLDSGYRVKELLTLLKEK